MFRIWIRVILGVLLSPGVYRTLAIELYTPKELTAVNGTDVRLKCTFKSTHPVSENTLSVSWSFKPDGPGHEEQFFYYQGKPFPPTQGQFKGRAVWTGNIQKNDVSIMLRDVQYNFNGTFTCQVRNPPDVHGYTGEIHLEVVQSVKLSEIGILAAAVGGGIVLVLIILVVVLIVRHCRRRHRSSGIELSVPKPENCSNTEKEFNNSSLENKLEKEKLNSHPEKEKRCDDPEKEELEEDADTHGGGI